MAREVRWLAKGRGGIRSDLVQGRGADSGIELPIAREVGAGRALMARSISRQLLWPCYAGQAPRFQHTN